MPTLPVEVIFLIVDHMDREDLKSMRLASSALKLKATQPLFKEVNLSPFADSFDRLDRLAQDASLSHHVRVFAFHSNTFDLSYNLADYTKKVATAAYGRDCLPADLALYYERYSGFRRLQLQFDFGDPSRTRLGDIFRKLPNITTLQNVFDLPYPPNRRTWSTEKDMSELGYYGRTCLLPLENGGSASAKNLDAVIRTACDARLKISRLRCAGLTGSYMYPWGVASTAPLLANLQSVSLSTVLLDREEATQLFDLVAATATNITHLALAFADSLDSMNILDLHPTQTTWPKLTNLSLSGFRGRGSNFVSFLQAHAKTLRVLSLSDCELEFELFMPHAASWELVFHKMRSTLGLTGVSLNGYFMMQYSNLFGDAWRTWATVRTSPCTTRKESMKSRVEGYITGDGECPFPDQDDFSNISANYDGIMRDKGCQRTLKEYYKQVALCRDSTWSWGERGDVSFERYGALLDEVSGH